MGVGAGLYMCDVVKKFTFAISSPDEFLFLVEKSYTIISETLHDEFLLYKEHNVNWALLETFTTEDRTPSDGRV